MTPRSFRRLCRGRDLALAVAVLSAAMLVVTTVSLAGAPSAVAATDAGEVSFTTPATGGGGPAGGGATTPVTSGGSALPIAVGLPAGAACTGDSAGGGYRVQTFMVPATVDLAALKFDSNGPVKPAGADGIWYPLFSTASDPLVNLLTDIATIPNGPGLISGLPLVDFLVYSPGDLPAGEYFVGVACTLGNQTSANQLDRYWSVPMTFTEAVGDPAGVTWNVTGSPATTTTTTTVPDDSTTTTTLLDSSTTTSTPGSTTSTTAGSGATTTSTFGAGGGSGTGGSSTGTGAGGTTLPATGVSSWVLAAWAFLLVVAGRMAWLVGRRIRVVDHSA